MSAPFTTVPGDTPGVSPGTATDRAGDFTMSGNLVLSNGVLKLGTVSGAPLPLPGVVQLYTLDGISVSSVGAGGQGVSQTISGNLTVTGNASVGLNLIVGGATPTGDNGVREIQLKYASTIPTSPFPSGGVAIYATSSHGLFMLDNNGTYSSLISSPQSSAAISGAIAETMHVYTASGSQSPVSGTLYIQKVFIPAGQTVANIAFVTSTTAATGPTNWWTALLDNTYKQLAHSADQLTAAIPASTWQNLPMVTPWTANYSGYYYLAFMIKTSTTQPTIACGTTAPLTVFVTGAGAPTPLPNGASTSGLTSPGTDGTTTYAAPTASSTPYYLYAS